MKKTMTAFFLGAVFGLLYAQTADEIMAKTRQQTSFNSIGTRSKIEIQKGGKALSEFLIDQYSSKDKDGLQRTLIEFKEPANARGIRFLMTEQKNAQMVLRGYLPKLGKVQRISVENQGNESFMGTDFSFNDISFLNRDPKLDVYKILREEELHGINCYVIEAVSKDKNYIYSKSILWIEKADNVLYQAEFYGADGVLKKVMELSNYKKVRGVNTPHSTKLTTVKTNTSTIIRLEKIQYGMKIPEGVFTTKYLETGKR